VTRHIEGKPAKEDILSFVVNAKDPVTGTIFDFEELQLNAQTLLYSLIPGFSLTQCRFHGYDCHGSFVYGVFLAQGSSEVCQVA
jgi:hypothetical protein